MGIWIGNKVSIRTILNPATIMSTPYNPSCVYVDPADGTRIYSEAVGDITKPCIVPIHRFQLSSVAFDPIFNDPKWTDQLLLGSSTSR